MGNYWRGNFWCIVTHETNSVENFAVSMHISQEKLDFQETIAFCFKYHSLQWQE